MTTPSLTPPALAFSPALADRFRTAFQTFGEAVERTARALSRLTESLRETANDPVRVAGLEARYLVRAGLDPAVADPEARDALVRAILDGTVDDDLLAVFLSPDNRRACATAALLGWAQRHPSSEPYVLHRLWGNDRVEVSCG